MRYIHPNAVVNFTHESQGLLTAGDSLNQIFDVCRLVVSWLPSVLMPDVLIQDLAELSVSAVLLIDLTIDAKHVIHAE